MAKKQKIGFVSLGCSKNLCDTEIMLRHLVDEGFEITPEETEADVVIVNTCAFIESAKKESIDNILDLGWLKKHGKLKGIIVTGCLAERYREEVTKELPEVDALVGTASWDRIAEALDRVLAEQGADGPIITADVPDAADRPRKRRGGKDLRGFGLHAHPADGPALLPGPGGGQLYGLNPEDPPVRRSVPRLHRRR